MAQQVFDQYAPLAKVSANETIPVVAAIAQTRDGKDELLHGTVPFVPGPGGLYVPVSASNRMPVEATLTGHYIEVIKDQSTVVSAWRYWGETVGTPPTQIPRMDVSRYRAVRLICINTTDIQFNLYRGRFYYEPIGADDQHVMYTPFQNISVPAGAVVILDEEEFPLLGKGGLWAMWRTNGDGTATVGQFRIITLGVLR